MAPLTPCNIDSIFSPHPLPVIVPYVLNIPSVGLWKICYSKELITHGTSFSSHFSRQTMKCLHSLEAGKTRHRMSFKPQTVKGGNRGCGVARNVQHMALKHPLWTQHRGQKLFGVQGPQLYFQSPQSARRKRRGILVSLGHPTSSGPPGLWMLHRIRLWITTLLAQEAWVLHGS